MPCWNPYEVRELLLPTIEPPGVFSLVEGVLGEGTRTMCTVMLNVKLAVLVLGFRHRKAGIRKSGCMQRAVHMVHGADIAPQTALAVNATDPHTVCSGPAKELKLFNFSSYHRLYSFPLAYTQGRADLLVPGELRLAHVTGLCRSKLVITTCTSLEDRAVICQHRPELPGGKSTRRCCLLRKC